MIKIFFATDFHGSTICFRKFLRAPTFYGADIVFMGGDYTSKDLILYSRTASVWEAVSGANERMVFKSDSEFEHFKTGSQRDGKMLEEVDASSLRKLDKHSYNAIFETQIKAAHEAWYELAAGFANLRRPIYVIPGNDDPPFTDDIFSRSPFEFLHRKYIEIEEGISVIGWGGSNPTPWHTIRECSESDIAVQLEAALATRSTHRPTILFSHPPPLSSGLDLAPVIKEDFTYSFSMGSVRRKAIGSTAVREFVEKHQPALGLFGHVHEGRGHHRIGRTICINPGSAFFAGRLQGCLVSLDRGEVVDFQFTEG